MDKAFKENFATPISMKFSDLTFASGSNGSSDRLLSELYKYEQPLSKQLAVGI